MKDVTIAASSHRGWSAQARGPIRDQGVKRLTLVSNKTGVRTPLAGYSPGE